MTTYKIIKRCQTIDVLRSFISFGCVTYQSFLCRLVGRSVGRLVWFPRSTVEGKGNCVGDVYQEAYSWNVFV